MFLLWVLKQHKDNLAIIKKNKTYETFRKSIEVVCLVLFIMPYILTFIYQFSPNYNIGLSLTICIISSLAVRLLYVVLVYGLILIINEKE